MNFPEEKNKEPPRDSGPVDPLTVVSGNDALTAIYGHWPSFHDAEVIELNLWRGFVKSGEWGSSSVFPTLTVKVRILEATQVDATDAGHDVIATIRFHDVVDLKLDEFNHVNQITKMSFAWQPRGRFTDGTPLPSYIIVNFERGFGISASFKCFRIEIVDVLRDAIDPL